MWMFDEIKHLPLDTMKVRGLELSPKEITNLREAIVLIGGGSGAFVSPNGLILTNHHVAYGAIQRESTLEENFIQNGFLASTWEEEIPAPEYDVYITKYSKDVTDKMLKAVPGIGPKTASRMIVELKEKIGLAPALQAFSRELEPTEDQKQLYDATLALIKLGYTQAAAQKALRKVLQETEERVTVEQLVKKALKYV